jgi:hypothetical protein
MPRARRAARSILMGGTGRRKKRGVSKKRRGRGLIGSALSLLGLGRRRRTRGRGAWNDMINLANNFQFKPGAGRRRTRGGSLFADFVNNTKNGLVPGRGRRRYSRRRGGAMRIPHTPAPAARAAPSAPPAVKQAVAQVAAAVPAKSGSKVKTALKTLAGLAGLAGAAYLGHQTGAKYKVPTMRYNVKSNTLSGLVL